MEQVNQGYGNHPRQKVRHFFNRLVQLYKVVIEIKPYIDAATFALLEEMQKMRSNVEQQVASSLHLALGSTTESVRKTMLPTHTIKPVPTKKIQTHILIPSINEPVDSHVKSVELRSISPTESEPEMLGGSDLDVTGKIDLELFRSYADAVQAVQIAVEAAVEVATRWEIEKKFGDMIALIMERMEKEIGSVSRKSTRVVKIVEYYSQQDIKQSSYQLLQEWVVDYGKSSQKLDSRIGRNLINKRGYKFWDTMMKEWIKDISGIFLAASETWVVSNENWAQIKNLVVDMIQSIISIHRAMIDKRPYLDVQLIWLDIDRYYNWNEGYYSFEKVYSIIRDMETVVQAMMVFQKMDEKMDQMEEAALALGQALKEMADLGESSFLVCK